MIRFLFILGLVLVALNAAHLIFILWVVAFIPWIMIIIYGFVILLLECPEDVLFLAFLFAIFD